VPIPGTTKPERLQENLRAVDVVLTAEELLRFDSALSKISVAGDRYPEALEKRTGLNTSVQQGVYNIQVRESEQLSKTILVLSASPRKGGNSDRLCDRFIKGAEEAGNRPKKFPEDKKINYCWAAAPARAVVFARRKTTWPAYLRKWLPLTLS